MIETATPGAHARPGTGGRQHGDRIVRCGLPAGHFGPHVEDETEVTWTALTSRRGVDHG